MGSIITQLTGCGASHINSIDSTDLTTVGATVYSSHCVGCHGVNGSGGSGGGLSGNLSDGTIEDAVRNGRSGMPSYNTGTISDTDLTALIQYVQTF